MCTSARKCGWQVGDGLRERKGRREHQTLQVIGEVTAGLPRSLLGGRVASSCRERINLLHLKGEAFSPLYAPSQERIDLLKPDRASLLPSSTRSVHDVVIANHEADGSSRRGKGQKRELARLSCFAASVRRRAIWLVWVLNENS